MGIFQGMTHRQIPNTTVRNHAGGEAVNLSPGEGLANLVLTSTFNSTFYTDGEEQVKLILELARKVDSRFIAQLILYAHGNGKMRDSVTFLLAHLSTRDTKLFKTAFTQTVRTGRDIRNFVEVIRSGLAGRKSLGTVVKRAIQLWFTAQSATDLVYANIGNAPTLADVIRLAHVKPLDYQEEVFKWILGYPVKPAVLQDYYLYLECGGQLPKVPFEMLMAIPNVDWKELLQQMTFNQVLGNLNNLKKHEATDARSMLRIRYVLENPELLAKARVFPFRMYTAFQYTNWPEIRSSLKIALESSLQNVPVLGKIVLCPDVSGSMQAPVTGVRKGATSVLKCSEAAAVFTTAMAKRIGNTAHIIPFDTHTHEIRNGDFMETIRNIADAGGGGTDVTAPLHKILMRDYSGLDAVVILSDNESWAHHSQAGIAQLWQTIKGRNPGCKLVLWDLAPNITTPINNGPDVLNIGGFSEEAFNMIEAFCKGEVRNLAEVVQSVII